MPKSFNDTQETRKIRDKLDDEIHKNFEGFSDWIRFLHRRYDEKTRWHAKKELLEDLIEEKRNELEELEHRLDFVEERVSEAEEKMGNGLDPSESEEHQIEQLRQRRDEAVKRLRSALKDKAALGDDGGDVLEKVEAAVAERRSTVADLQQRLDELCDGGVDPVTVSVDGLDETVRIEPVEGELA